MSRVYRALEKAEEEKAKREGTSQGTPPGNLGERPPLPRVEPALHPPERKKITELTAPPREQPPVLMVSPDSYIAEEFRKLRTQVFHHASHPHSILVTSANPEEGKTVVAVNLAAAISQEIQKKAILIDADLRKPSIYTEKFSDSKGLSNYLSEQTPLSEIMIDLGAENLRIIPAGSPTDKPAEMIGSRRMGALFLSLRELGDDTYIIVDSSPLLSTSEPTLISKMVDGVILVVMAGKTPREMIQRAVKSIDPQKIIGVVLNGTEMKSSSYYSNYYSTYRRPKNGKR